jgi:hypothetical protein
MIAISKARTFEDIEGSNLADARCFGKRQKRTLGGARCIVFNTFQNLGCNLGWQTPRVPNARFAAP